MYSYVLHCTVSHRDKDDKFIFLRIDPADPPPLKHCTLLTRRTTGYYLYTNVTGIDGFIEPFGSVSRCCDIICRVQNHCEEAYVGSRLFFFFFFTQSDTSRALYVKVISSIHDLLLLNLHKYNTRTGSKM